MNDFDFNEISLGITTPMANECNTAIDFIKEVFEECDKYNFKSISYFVIFDKACNDETYELLRNYTSFESRLKTIYDSDSKSVVDAYITLLIYYYKYTKNHRSREKINRNVIN